MSTVRVKPEEFEKAVMKAIAQYGDKTTDMLEAETKKIARQTVKDLKASAPAGGQYARGWSHKAQKGGAYKLSDTVYDRQGQLTHLLEKPHPTGRGSGKYPSHVDYTGTMARIEDKNTNRFMEEVMAKL